MVEANDKTDNIATKNDNEISIEEVARAIDEVTPPSPVSVKTKSRKNLPSVKGKRNQRKKNMANTKKEKAIEIEATNDQSLVKQTNTHNLVQQSYPSYVISKRVGCGRSGPHRKKKPTPKVPPKLTVVISKVGGQIIAKQKEESSVKQETSLCLKPTNLSRKSLEVF